MPHPKVDTHEHLPYGLDRLRPLFQELGEPRPGDWLYEHEETGQTYRQYLDDDPVTPQGKRRVIYLQPIGNFSPDQERILKATADFMERYFQLPLRTQPAWPASDIPDTARREHPAWGMEQIRTGYVLKELLKRGLPDDAAAMLALTATDLWPGAGWNFVFGEASISDRVGVWSLYRNGDPAKDHDAFRLCLLRTIKTASHETGHMFSMQHCTMYDCNMCGSNSLEESDRGTLALCPECLAKVCHATKIDPIKRYESLVTFCEQNGLASQKRMYSRLLDRLQTP